MYLHNSYDNEIFNTYKSNYWEGLFVKVMNKNSYVYLGNIYRPPIENSRNEIIPTFTLTIKHKLIHTEFLENMLAFHQYPTLTLPTRITQYRATLIDNIFSNNGNLDSQLSGIIVSDISDHFPCVYSFTKSNKFKTPQILLNTGNLLKKTFIILKKN